MKIDSIKKEHKNGIVLISLSLNYKPCNVYFKYKLFILFQPTPYTYWIFIQFLKWFSVIKLYFYYMSVTSCCGKDVNSAKQKSAWDCWIQFLLLAFMCYIMVVSISMDLKRKKLFLIKAVFNLVFVVVLSARDNYFKYVIDIIYYETFYQKTNSTILRASITTILHCEHENLSITFLKTTNVLFLFPTAVPRTTLQWSIPLLCLVNCVFYIHPTGHVWVSFRLYVKTSLSTKPFIGPPPTGSLTHFYVKCFDEDSFWNRSKRKYKSMSCSQEPLLL